MQFLKKIITNVYSLHNNCFVAIVPLNVHSASRLPTPNIVTMLSSNRCCTLLLGTHLISSKLPENDSSFSSPCCRRQMTSDGLFLNWFVCFWSLVTDFYLPYLCVSKSFRLVCLGQRGSVKENHEDTKVSSSFLNWFYDGKIGWKWSLALEVIWSLKVIIHAGNHFIDTSVEAWHRLITVRCSVIIVSGEVYSPSGAV